MLAHLLFELPDIGDGDGFSALLMADMLLRERADADTSISGENIIGGIVSISPTNAEMHHRRANAYNGW